MDLIDTHCHLYLQNFKEDISDVIQRAIDAGITKFYLPCIDSWSIEDMLALETKYSNLCTAMIGLHPCSVKENYKKELAAVEQWLQKKNSQL